MFYSGLCLTEDEMTRWHHWLDGRESEWTPGVGDGQGGLACCGSWGRKESDTTERLNWTDVWDNLITWPKGYKGMLFWLQFDQREQSLAWKFVITQNWSESHAVMSNSLRLDGLCSPWNSPDQNTGVGSPSLLQGIFPAQGLSPGLPHCRRILYQLSHQGSPITQSSP